MGRSLFHTACCQSASSSAKSNWTSGLTGGALIYDVLAPSGAWFSSEFAAHHAAVCSFDGDFALQNGTNIFVRTIGHSDVLRSLYFLVFLLLLGLYACTLLWLFRCYVGCLGS